MELQQINQRIAVVNGESKRLNSERQVLIGRRQTLEKQLSDALAAYKQQYGIELTAENIGAEIARVSALKDAEVSGIETMLGLIKAGRYEEAEQMANAAVAASAEEPVMAAPEQEQQESQEQQDAPPFEPESAPVQAPVDVKPAAASASPPVEVPPSAPAAPPMPPTFTRPAEPVAPPVQSAPPAAPPAPPASRDDAPPAPPPPFKPKPLGTPKLGVPPAVGQSSGSGKMSFQAILSGEAFNPQNVGGNK